MNGVIWIAQIILACLFLYAGAAKIFALPQLVATLDAKTTTPISMTPLQGKLIGILEMAGALGVIIPPLFTPTILAEDYLLIRISAGLLALLMVGAGIYHVRRSESASLTISIFLTALFIIVGRWPS